MVGQTLTWNDRFALIDHFKPTDTQICEIFDIDMNALKVAKSFRKTGQFKPSKNIDVNSYAHIFQTQHNTVNPTKEINTKSKSATSIVKPITATKKSPVVRKRGRKGNNIKTAFSKISSTPVRADTFSEQHNVSVTVLRQGKRFDPTPEAGKVKVKKINMNGEKVLCVWRESVSSE